MKGELVITAGRQGWGNRKSGCEAYGPGGRWAGVYGDLLGDHLEELGAHEGSPFVVIASTSRFDAPLMDDFVAALTTWAEGWWTDHKEDPDE